MIFSSSARSKCDANHSPVVYMNVLSQPYSHAQIPKQAA